MNWLNDDYVISAADAAAYYASRTFDFLTGRWSSTPGVTISQSRLTNRRVKCMDMLIRDSSGALKDGIFVVGFVIANPTWCYQVLPWFTGMQSKLSLIQWVGDIPMLCGVQWRAHIGALAVDDVVSIGVGYE